MAISRRRLSTGIALAAVAVLVASCGGGSAGSDGKGSITVLCGATEEWCVANTEAFTAKTGIEAKFVRLSSGEAVAKLKAGQGSPEFDVWHGGPADGYVAAVEGGLLEPYVSPNAGQIRPEWKAADGSWTGVYVGVLGFCSNKKVLADKGLPVPASWSDLLDQRYAKNVSVAHPATSGTGFVNLWGQVALARGDESKAIAYMAALRPNILQFTKSGVGPVQQVGRGEIATGIVFSHDCVTARDQGLSDLEVSFPREGSAYEVGGVAAIKGARNSAEARAYVDWALTPEAQQIGATAKQYQVPTHPAAVVSDKAARLEQLTLITYDIAAAGKAKAALVKRFDAEIAPAPSS